MSVSRRAVVGAAVAAPFVPSAAGAATTWPGPNATTADWPQLCGYSDHLAVARAETGLTAASVGKLRQVWSRKVTVRNFPPPVPIAVGGRVFVTGAALSALDAATGAVKWTRSFPTVMLGSPAYARGIVVVTTRSPGPRVVAVNAATGALLWSVPLADDSWCSPSIAADVVYVVYRSTVLALSLDRGAVLWSRPIPQDAEGWHSSPTVRGGRVFVGTGGNALVTSFNASTGVLGWRRTLHDSNLYGVDLGPVAADAAGRVFAATGLGTVFALSQASGAVVWQAAPVRSEYQSVAVSGSTVIGSSGVAMDAFDAASGRLLWSRACVSGGVKVAVAAGLVYRFTMDVAPGLEVFDAASGVPVASVAVASWTGATGPCVSRGRVFTVDTTGMVRAFGVPG